MLLHHCFDAALGIASGALQIRLGIVDFVLMLSLMRGCQDELLVQRILLGSRSFCIVRSQTRHQRIVGIEYVFSTLQPRLNFFCLCAQSWWMVFCLALRRRVG